MPQKAAFRQQVENIETIDQRGHDQNYRPGRIAAVIEQARRAFAPHHRPRFVTAAVTVPAVGFQPGEIGFGAARDLEIKRRGDATRTDGVDFGREAAKPLAHLARHERRFFQEGESGPRARPQHHCDRQVRGQRARRQPAVQAALIARPSRRHGDRNSGSPRRRHPREARSDNPPTPLKNGGRGLMHRSSRSIYPELQTGGSICRSMARV